MEISTLACNMQHQILKWANTLNIHIIQCVLLTHNNKDVHNANRLAIEHRNISTQYETIITSWNTLFERTRTTHTNMPDYHHSMLLYMHTGRVLQRIHVCIAHIINSITYDISQEISSILTKIVDSTSIMLKSSIDSMLQQDKTIAQCSNDMNTHISTLVDEKLCTLVYALSISKKILDDFCSINIYISEINNYIIQKY